MKSWDDVKVQLAELTGEELIAQLPDHDALVDESISEPGPDEAAYLRALAHARRARDFTEEQLVQALGVKPQAVSKMGRQFEGDTNTYLATFGRFVAAMGGELRVVAAFPDADVIVDAFRELDSTKLKHLKPPKPEAI